MRDLIKRNLNGKKVLLLFAITNIIYAFMLLFTIPDVMGFSGGMKLLDMMPTGYNHAYVNSLFATLGETGRDAYLKNQIPVDMIYPLLFGLCYCLTLAYFLNKLGKLESPFFYLCFIPVFAAVFDYSENIGIITMLTYYPDNSSLQTQITNVFSILKSSFTMVFFLILLISFITFGFKKYFSNINA